MATLTIQEKIRAAIRHHQTGQLTQAESLYRQVLAQQPDHANALHFLGLIAHQTGRNDVAVGLIERAIALAPNNPGAYSNLGNVLKDQGQFDNAVAAHRRATALSPNSPETHNGLGVALALKGELDEAIAAYRRAVLLRPGFHEAHSNLGSALKSKGQLEAAVAAYRRTIALKPDYAEAHNNLGNALTDSGQLDEAIAAYRQAIALRPDYPDAHGNLGNALKDNGQLEEAIAEYRRAVAMKPDDPGVHTGLIYTMHYHAGCAAETIAEEHRRWNRQHAEPLKKFIRPHANDRNPERRLRIGYVSPDFRQHAVAPMVLPLLECHDRENFDLFCYAQVQNPDAMTERFRAQANHWRRTVSLSDERMAELIREDQIDILVDLAGHTAGGRLLVFARKPAPVQVARQGYPNTTGLTTIDYRMTDALADPPGFSDTLHSEELIRLPRTNWIYQPPENGPVPDHRMVDGLVTFGCFNNFAKVTEPMLVLWARILRAAPKSRLLLKTMAFGNPTTRQRVLELFINQGIEPARLDLRGNEPEHGNHLALYNKVDIGLDPFPYHGTTTTCEALWMGVPVVTLAGQTHVARVGVSLLTNVELPELIAESEDGYLAIAVELANDFPRLLNLHSTLRQRLKQSPVMDAPAFARNIESAYRQMWRKWCGLTSSGQ